MGTLVSVQVGRPIRRVMPEGAQVDFNHPAWTSGIFKEPVAGPVMVTAEGIPGDGQADPKNHGGPDNVVLAYDAGLYPHWRAALGKPELSFGAFGENFSVEGFSDESVCVGDVWEIGPQLQLQVTQARQPCYKLARRLEFAGIVKLVRAGRNGGWYMRVLAPGPAEAGMAIRRTARPHPDWPVARAVEIMYTRAVNLALAEELAALPELSARWKMELLEA